MANNKVQFILEAVDKMSNTMNDVDKNIQGFTKKNQVNFTKMAAIGTAAFTAITGTATAFAVQLGNTADRLLDLSDITGISTDTLQEYTAVARAAGVNSEALTNAAAGLTKRFKGMEDETSGVSKAMDTLGVNIRDANGDIKDMDSILMQSLDGLSSIESEIERNALANELFGKSYEDLIPIMSLGYEGINEIRQGARDMGLIMGNDALKGANDFRVAQENLVATFGAVKNAIGMSVIPILTELVAKLQPIISQMAIWGQENPKLMQTIIVLTAGFAGIIAVVGTLGLILPSIIIGIKAVGVAIALLTGPIGLIIAGVALLVAAFVTDFGGIRTITMEVFGFIKDFIISTWNIISTGFLQGLEILKSGFDIIMQSIQFIWESIWNGIKLFLEGIMIMIGLIFGLAFQLLTGDFQGFMDNLQAIWQFVWNGIKDFLSMIWNVIKNIFSTSLSIIQKVFTSTLNFILDFGKKIFNDLKEFIVKIIKFISLFFSKEGRDAMTSGFTTMLGSIGAVASSVFEGVLNTIIGFVNKAIGLLNKMINAANSIPGVSIPLIPEIPKIQFRAKGGPVEDGNPYVVGEKGPELFVPNGSGKIIPNHKLGSNGGSNGSGGINITLSGNNFYGDDQTFAEKIGDMITKQVQQNLAINGF